MSRYETPEGRLARALEKIEGHAIIVVKNGRPVLLKHSPKNDATDLFKAIDQLGWGEARIEVKDGEIVSVEYEQNIKLSDN